MLTCFGKIRLRECQGSVMHAKKYQGSDERRETGQLKASHAKTPKIPESAQLHY